MNYTQAQIDRANAVSLEDFLHTQGETLIKSGREYRWKEHDSLTVRGNKWFRHSQSKGGYPIDFVMEFYGKSFPEAVQLLTGESGEGQTEATTAPPAEFHLPLHNRTVDRAIQYLCESRGLNKSLVETFLLSGDIYEDSKRHNVVFVGRDRSGTPRYAHVRGTQESFRQDIAGSDKSYPFRYEGNGSQLFVFEAPIEHRLYEAANTGQVPQLEKAGRGYPLPREVSLCLLYQQLAQCKAIYDKHAETILGNMDSVVFLGGREANTIKEISENWLGKATISMQTDSRSRGQSESYSQNTQRLGRELMTPAELATMPGDKCIFAASGPAPVLLSQV